MRRNTDCVEFVHSNVSRELFGATCSEVVFSPNALEKDTGMQIVLIDSFVVPDGSKEAFLQRVRQSGDILKTSPGLIEGYVYEKKSGDSDVNVVTTAVWQDEKALKCQGSHGVRLPEARNKSCGHYEELWRPCLTVAFLAGRPTRCSACERTLQIMAYDIGSPMQHDSLRRTL